MEKNHLSTGTWWNSCNYLEKAFSQLDYIKTATIVK